jgi:hypothetical protein
MIARQRNLTLCLKPFGPASAASTNERSIVSGYEARQQQSAFVVSQAALQLGNAPVIGRADPSVSGREIRLDSVDAICRSALTGGHRNPRLANVNSLNAAAQSSIPKASPQPGGFGRGPSAAIRKLSDSATL